MAKQRVGVLQVLQVKRQAVSIAKLYGFLILSLPSHMSITLQPLDNFFNGARSLPVCRIHLNGFDGQGSKRAKLCLLMRWDGNFITHGHALQLLAPEEEHVPAGQGEQNVPALEF